MGDLARIHECVIFDRAKIPVRHPMETDLIQQGSALSAKRLV
ncbi:MAG: hypothetical protein RL042_403 [Nitrospirota bacterium]